MQQTELEIEGAGEVPIHVLSRGAGSTLVFMHGTAASARRWGKVADKLASRYRVIEYDRRGRGDSGDTADYTLEHEATDLVRVLRECGHGSSVDLLAHSYGALIALAGLPALQNLLRRLVLYEAPLSIPHQCQFIDMDDVNELDSTLKQQGNEAATDLFLRRFPRATEVEINELKNSSSWAQRIAAAPTLGRELRAAHDFTIKDKSLSECRLPCLILLGGASPEPFQISAQYLCEHIPQSRLEILEGQRHRAMDTIPDQLAQKIELFLQE